jgi:hypothetical protein
MDPAPLHLARRAVIALTLVLGLGSALQAGDITAFVAQPTPTDTWDRGYGAALSSTWFSVIGLEGEAARMPGQDLQGTITSFTGSVLLAPPIGIVTPYGGIGVGVFRQSVGRDSDLGTLRAFVLGAKVKLGIVVVKGEYRRIELSGDPLLPLTARVSLGAGISF